MTKYIAIKHWAEDDKPREKLANQGRNTLSLTELIAILLTNGTKNKSAIDLARELLQLADNDLNTLSKMDIPQLCKINGIGPAKAITLIAAIELGNRRETASPSTTVIGSSKDGYTYFKPLLQDKNYEEFWILLLSQNNTIIKSCRVSDGGISQTLADPKRIFKIALENNTSNMILCHNHPSGNLNPSQADIKLTQKLIQASKTLDIHIMDHIIIAHTGYFSFADEGKLNNLCLE